MLKSLSIQDFRCIAKADLELSPTLNLISGPNASGKTSLLEALFFLGRARSFRTARVGPLIRDGASELMVVAQLERDGKPTPLGVRRGRQHAEMRLAGEPLKSLAELAQAFPVQILDPTVHGLLDDGPRERRRFLDWGVFHVEHGFQQAWQRYSRALRQRNILLRQQAQAKELVPWEGELAEAGTRMDELRRHYLSLISPILEASSQKILETPENVSVEYQPGWTRDMTLEAALVQSRERDRAAGSTQVGPHRADILIKLGGHRAQDRVSRGQQKVLAGVLVLTQLAEYRRHSGKRAVLLADDLSAELDPAHLERFLSLAREGDNQLFITAIRPETLPDNLVQNARVFHVERGAVTDCS